MFGEYKVELDPLDLEWREESIIDPLSEGIFVDRLAKIVVGIHIIISLRSCSESEVDGRGEVAEDLCPVTIFSRTTSMTLIDDDEIEKISLVAIVVWFEDFLRISPQGVLSFFKIHLILARSSRECLIDCKEDIRIRRDNASFLLDKFPIDLDTVFLQRVECIHRLIHEDIAIGEDEDARSTSADPIARPPRLKELVCDLKSNHCLTGTGREGEEDTISTFSNILHYPRDRNFLVIPRTLCRDKIRLPEENLFSMIIRSDHSLVELLRCRIPLNKVSSAKREIKLINLSAIGRVDISQSEDLAILFDLFESLSRMEIVFFCFDNSKIDPIVLQKIICKFLLAFATDKFASIREGILTDDV